MELIDKAKLKTYIADLCQCCGCMQDDECGNCYIEDVYTYLNTAKTIEAEPVVRWISVEDRLPEKGEVVLAFGTRSASTGQFQGVGAKPWFWYWKGTIRRVTHWMPLPEAPKKED